MPDLDLRTGIIKPEAPFDFSHSLRTIRTHPATKNDQKVDGNQIIKAFQQNNKPFAMQVVNEGNKDYPKLKCTVIAKDEMDDQELESAIQRIRFFLGVDEDITSFYELGREDSYFKPLIQKLHGHHIVKFISFFEASLWMLLKEHFTIEKAADIKKNIQLHLGTMININGVNYRAFPEAENIVNLPEDDLILIVSDDQIRNRIIKLAEYVVGFDDHKLSKLSNDEIKAELIQLKGIDEETALSILNYGLGRLEDINTKESTFVKAVNEVYGSHYNIDMQTIKELASHYNNWKGYWAHYLKVYLAETHQL